MGYFRTAILLAAMTALFMGIGYLIGGQTGMVIAFLVAAAMNLFAYWNSDRVVLSMYGAREVDERAAPELYGLVRQLAADAGLPMPKVYIMDNPQPNAFATGRNPEHAAVAVTTGLLERLNRDELAGVLAHELGHVKHRDTLTMTITATLAGAISMLANFGFYFGGSRNNDGVGPIGGLMLVILAPIAAALVQFGISRGPRIRGRPHRRRDQQAPAVARLSLAQDFERGGADSQSARRAQSGVGASLHRQPAVGRADGQSVLHPPQCGEPHRPAGRDRRAHGSRRRRGDPRARRTRVRTLGVAATGRLAEARSLGPDLNRLDHSDELRRRDARLGRRAGGAGRPSGAARGS